MRTFNQTKTSISLSDRLLIASSVYKSLLEVKAKCFNLSVEDFEMLQIEVADQLAKDALFAAFKSILE